MAIISSISRVPLLAAVCMLVCANSHAQTPLLDEVHTVAAADHAVPVEETFTIATAGTYNVTLTDLGATLTPTAAPLASLKLAVTNGSSSIGTPLTAAGSMSFSATPGTYVIHVIGAPSTDPSTKAVIPGSGLIGMQVTSAADNSQVAAFSDTLAFPTGSTVHNVGVINDTFTVAAAGTYQVTLADLQLPQALTTLTLAIAVEGGSLLTDPTFGTVPGTPVVSTTVSLQPGVSYRIFAGGQAGQPDGTGLNAGLYGVSVSPVGGGAPVYSKSVPVGAVSLLGSPALTAGNYTLSASDLGFPNTLSQVGAAVTLNGQTVAQLTATGNKAFAATSNTYQVFALGLAASAGQGSYSIALQPPAGGAALSVARAVTDAGSASSAYSFDTSVAPETYSLALADFGYPASFASIKIAAVQNGALLGTALNGVGTASITPAAGPVTLLVFAQPTPPASQTGVAGGLFGINLTANGAGSATFETTQGVGQLFSVRKVTIATGGNYQVVVSDVGFPDKFANLAVIVTRGTSPIGSIFGGGTLPFAAVSGDYLINFVAQPGNSSDEAGTYAMTVGLAPPAPSATLQASATSIDSGGTVTLTWSSQNATSCSAASTPASVWTGNLAVSGSTTSPALTAATTFTLTCAGSDGTSVTKTVTVSINSAASGGGGGGGGAIRPDLLVFLFGLLLLRVVGSRGVFVMRTSRTLPTVGLSPDYR